MTVTNDNKPVIHLYKILGFQIYGVDRKLLKVNNKYIDEI